MKKKYVERYLEEVAKIAKTIDKNKSKKTIKDYISASQSGLIRGCIIGYILGDKGLYSSLSSGTTYAIINPMIMYLGYG